MNEYLIEYYNIEPNERLEVVRLANRTPDNWKNNRNEYKLAELDGYFMIHNAHLADIEDILIPYNNAWWLYTKADSIKEAIDKFYGFYDIFEKEKLTRTYIATANEIRQAMGLKVENDPEAETLIKKECEQ